MMGAIYGIYNPNKQPVSKNYISQIVNALNFPTDDIQIWHKENIFLGCHAQWITPESIDEQVPYYDYERQLTITADAIIDNREELFSKLNIDGEMKKIMPDSQLILLAYDKWGEDCPKHLVGDFAFVIWDENKKKLFGARDFSGSRTFYFHFNEQKFTFCTIINPLLNLPYVKKELNDQWLAEFLAISSVIEVVDTSITVFKGIEQLPPSHTITIIDDSVKLSRYNTLESRAPIKLNSDQEYEEAFREVFQEAVKDRTRTHRQVGSHLSGGLDSGAVVSFAAKALRSKQKELHTFSYIPPNDFTDFTSKYRLANERPFIESTIKHVGGVNDNFLKFEDQSAYKDIDTFLEIMEGPYKFFENSIWLKGIFKEASKKNIGVLLNGGRGNLTVSWGPALEYYAILFKKMKWLRLTQEIDLYSNNMNVKKIRTLKYVLKMAYPSLNRISPSINKYESQILINENFAKKTGVYEKLKLHGIDENSSSIPDIYEARKSHFKELFHWNATNTLGTKLSLRYKLWKRDPTNDLRIIRFCLSVPENQYVQNGLDRALIRRSTKGYLPEKVRLNQLYRGVQGVDWVHRMISSWDMLIEELEQLSKDISIFDYLNEQVVKDAISKVKEGPKSEKAVDPYYRIALRSLIVYRFLKKMF